MNNEQQWYFQLLLSWIWTTHSLLCCQKDHPCSTTTQTKSLDPFIKEGEMKFLKNGCNGRGGQELGCWFYNGGDVKILKSPYIFGRGLRIPLFYEDPPSSFIAHAPPFQMLSTPPPLPCHLKPPPPLFVLLSCFFGWMGDHGTIDVLFYIMIW